MTRRRRAASTKPLPPRAHPWPSAIGKALRLGLFMHLLAAPLFALGIIGILGFRKSGDPVALLISMPFMAYGILIETTTVWRGLYRKQFCRLVEIWGGGQWVESAARTKLATPCQRRLMLSAATDAGYAVEAQAILAKHPVSTWKVWTWMRAAKRLKDKRSDAPFSLPEDPDDGN